MKNNPLKEECKECGGSGYKCICEDGWVWKFSKIRECTDFVCKKCKERKMDYYYCTKCKNTGVITEPIRNGEIELKYSNYCEEDKLIGTWDLIKKLLDNDWRVK